MEKRTSLPGGRGRIQRPVFNISHAGGYRFEWTIRSVCAA